MHLKEATRPQKYFLQDKCNKGDYCVLFVSYALWSRGLVFLEEDLEPSKQVEGETYVANKGRCDAETLY